MSALPIPCPRVTLRRLRASDLADFQAYRHDPAVGLYQGWSPEPDEVALSFLLDMASATLLAPGAWCQVGIALTEGDRLIGDIGIHVAADLGQAELGFSLARPHQGRGLATEAVQAALTWVLASVAVPRVIGVTDARNVASARLLERVGMRFVKAMETRFRGAPCTEHLYALERGA